jgi:hypothetical protein
MSIETNLTTVDGQLLDGFDFCRTVYELFDHIRSSDDGVARLRLRPTLLEKRLVEELIPLSRYVQARYREGRRIEVCWKSGSQAYDAELMSTGVLVDQGMFHRKMFVEITTSVHKNEYLLRELADEGGVVFGPEGTSRNTETKQIVSEPHIMCNDEHIVELAEQISKAIDSKRKKISSYPTKTVLIVNCVLSRPLLDCEWLDATERVQSKTRIEFEEIFLITQLGLHSATFHKEIVEE